jgi:hypothetical protein
MGQLYSERFGMTVICLRIGYLNEADDPWLPIPTVDIPGPTPSPADLAGMWISHRDLAQLVRRCLTADHVRFGVFYATSANAGSKLDITEARAVLGYEPVDDSATVRATHRARITTRQEGH